jgi:Sec7-like guanine-nucleotide exchange factor
MDSLNDPELVLRRSRKEIEHQFDQKWSRGIKMLAERYRDVFGQPLEAGTLADILYSWKFNKEMMGEFFGQNVEFNLDVLKIFLARFVRVEGLGVDDCVRNCFRLFSPPKESQQIQRIMKILGDEYIRQNPRT